MSETIDALPWTEDDGGRAAAGFGGSAGDCVVRAVCIALGQGYEATYTDIMALAQKSPAKGVCTSVLRPYMEERGWAFHYAGRKTLTAANLPQHPRIIATLSAHVAAIVDGVVRDTYSSSGKGHRKFYGYFAPADEAAAVVDEDPRIKRMRITRKVRALLARTVENGATTAEAEAALAIANKLMAEHALTFKDINDVRDDTYVEVETSIGKYARNNAVLYHPVRPCLHAISRFAVCQHWFRGPKVVFFGTKIDTEIAVHLIALYSQQLDRDLADYQRAPEGRRIGEPPPTRRANYIAAWTGARSRRLDALTRERNAPPVRAPVRYTEGTELAAPEAEQAATQARGRELMIVREQVLKEKYDSHTKDWAWGRARRTSARYSSTNPHTTAAARSAESRGDLGIDKKLR